ncbi:uncharacterized protein LOC108740386 [Agrilus planipennis]|uniref:Uncharacterized protein LOC108740386 n=1 Tax=Agrilus planipennis TaxID=224129 RepID=A0A7F5R0V3_AGRPL|nr:uncharacterized protein LOC108740386 [Agrilus planipennis]
MEGFDATCPAVPPHSALGKPDSLNSEFLYYSSILKVLAPAMSEEYQRQQIVPWIKKLFRPEYHSSKFREKRNRYLLYLTITLLNDESYGIFTTCPPEGALPELHDLEHVPVPAAEWELDRMWVETLNGLPKDFQCLQCSIHKNSHECEKDHKLDMECSSAPRLQLLEWLGYHHKMLLSSWFSILEIGNSHMVINQANTEGAMRSSVAITEEHSGIKRAEFARLWSIRQEAASMPARAEGNLKHEEDDVKFNSPISNDSTASTTSFTSVLYYRCQLRTSHISITISSTFSRYACSLRLAGPFMEYPPWKSLQPLAEAAKLAVNTKPITDPTGPDANEFLAGQPIPEEGAFCYIAITGELVASSFGK